MNTNIKQLTPAFAIHPGEIILDEIKAKGFSQASFAKQIGMEKSQLNEIIKGKRDVNTEFALLLEATLGVEAIYWLNIQSQYNIDVAKIQKKSEERLVAIQKYNEVSDLVAFKYLKKQGVLSGDPLVDNPVIESIYGVENMSRISELMNSPQFARFRRSETLAIDKTNLIGWVKFSEYTAKKVEVNNFNADSWGELKQQLRKIICDNFQVRERAKDVLGQFGIKLLFQEKADQVPVDGIAFWSNDNPAISMTLRHNRLDNFAFTLFHELGHVYLHLLKDKSKEIIDLIKSDDTSELPQEEVEANSFASDNLIPNNDWADFKSVKIITEDEVEQFAEYVGIHPSVVLGRLCFESNHYKVMSKIKRSIG